jgi:hypothetical protein
MLKVVLWNCCICKSVYYIHDYFHDNPATNREQKRPPMLFPTFPPLASLDPRGEKGPNPDRLRGQVPPRSNPPQHESHGCYGPHTRYRAFSTVCGLPAFTRPRPPRTPNIIHPGPKSTPNCEINSARNTRSAKPQLRPSSRTRSP